MGCSDSKLDGLPAVVLCSDRCKFLDHALRHADALSCAHAAYTRSLSSFGDALRRCTDPNLPPHGPNHPPVVTREHRKINSPPKSAAALSRSPSTDSQSHIKFNSDADESSGKNQIKSASFNNNQLVPYSYDFESSEESLNTFFDKFTISYMKKEPTQSITYTHPVYENNHYEVNEFSQTDSSSWNLMNFFDPYDLPLRTSSRREIRALTVIGDSFRRYEQKLASESVSRERQSLLRSASESEKVIQKELEKSSETGNESSRRSVVAEVVREVNALFRKASVSGDGVFKLLGDDDERVSYTNNGYQETTRFMENKTMDGDSKNMTATMMTSSENTNLGSTLKKLCMWEKKLHREVKAEEKLRVFHARKSRELKQLVEKGAEANKIDAARSLIGSLSTSLKISIHVIAKISTKINKLRDDNLLPLITHIILSLSEMWKTMLECHRRQLRAITEAKVLDSVEAKLGSDDGALEGFMQVRLELHRWNLNFLRWVDSQKCFARSLNDWLLRCLTHEPEAAAKALRSSAMRGAPPVFAICNEWVQTLEGSIKEKDVIESMEGLYSYLKQITEDRIEVYLQPKKSGGGDSKEMERMVRVFVKENQKIHKAMQDIDKKKKKVHHRLGKSSYSMTPSTTGLQIGLEHVFAAVEQVAFHSMEAYDELCSKMNDLRVFDNNQTI